jgi:hypothetical protein
MMHDFMWKFFKFSPKIGMLQPLSSVPRPLTLVVWYLADSQARLLVLVSRHQALKPLKLRPPAPC